mmetsp:Transcript_22587/g.32380  ORF Transcript_22587/g.32380 Transcript_22587/m.32380 type:complete len:83 (-) Transcript_22587:244-492(-)
MMPSSIMVRNKDMIVHFDFGKVSRDYKSENKLSLCYDMRPFRPLMLFFPYRYWKLSLLFSTEQTTSPFLGGTPKLDYIQETL